MSLKRAASDTDRTPSARQFLVGATAATVLAAGAAAAQATQGPGPSGKATTVGPAASAPDDASAAPVGRASTARPAAMPVSRSATPPPAVEIPQASLDLVPAPYDAHGAHPPAQSETVTTTSQEPPSAEPTRASAQPAAGRSGGQSATTSAVDGSVWDALAACESGHGGPAQWDHDRFHHLDPYADARFYGGLHFNKRSWDWAVEVGGHDVPDWPHEATRGEQIAVAETLRRIHPSGWGAWPQCARRLGLR